MIDLSDLTASVPATVVSVGETRFTGAAISSREMSRGALFFALKGAARDGHDFVVDAVSAGAAGVVVERDVDGVPGGVTVVRVPDTLAALQAAGAAVRRRSRAAVVAVTGSAGKTTTKDMVTCVLASRFDGVHRSEASFNNHLGVPLTLLGTGPEHTHVVSEIGTNHRGEIAALARLVEPDVGIVTNVGFAHVGNFADRAELAAEKTDLLRHVRPGGRWIVNGDDELLSSTVRDLPARGATVVTVGFGVHNTLRATDVHFDEAGTTGVVVADGQKTPFALPVVGKPFVYAALFALAVGRAYGVDVDTGIEAVRRFTAPRGRANLVRLPGGPLVVDDSYNASPDATLAALDLLGDLPATVRVAVLGEMRELGGESVTLHELVGNKSVAAATHLVVVGDGGKALVEGARNNGFPPERIRRGASALDALQMTKDIVSAAATAATDAAVLVKGSRFTHMERVFLGLGGTQVGCGLETCRLYINCETCPKLANG